MLISVFTDILERPFEDALDLLAGSGFTTVDLRSQIGDDNVDTLTDKAAVKVKRALDIRGLKVGCIASWGVNPMHGDYDPTDPNYLRTMRDRTVHLAKLAHFLEAKNVRVYSFKRPQHPISDTERADNAAFLTELAILCAEYDCTLLVENEPPTLTSTCAELGDLMRRGVPANLKINWDIVNGWRAGEIPWEPGIFDAIAGHVAHVHMKGAIAAPDGSFAAMALPGEDDIPHPMLFKMLLGSGFDGIITIDPHYGEFREADKPLGPDPILEVVKRTRAYLIDLLESENIHV